MTTSALPQQPVVLIVEDHPVNQKVAGLLLTSMGFQTRLADDGRPAIESYKEQRPDVILMDIMMPVMDGFHASKEIRRLEFGHSVHTPIIACTALDGSKLKEECIASGIDDYIGKPYSRELLARKMEHWLAIKVQLKPLTATAEAFAAAMAPHEPFDRQQLRLLYGLEQLDDILALFLTVTETLLAQLDSAIQTHDPASVRKIAFAIRSGSYAIDAKDIARLCLDLEEAVSDWPEVIKTYSALALAFSKVREFKQYKQLHGEESAGLMTTELQTKSLSSTTQPCP
jgi:two-component system sensor histidine kinase/response regulator